MEAKLKAEVTRHRQSLQRVSKEKDEVRRQHQVMERKAQGLASENTTSKRTIKRLQDELKRLQDDLKRSRAAAASRGAMVAASPRVRKVRTDSLESAGVESDASVPTNGLAGESDDEGQSKVEKEASDGGSVGSSPIEEAEQDRVRRQNQEQQGRSTTATLPSRSPSPLPSSGRRSDGTTRPTTAPANSTRRKAGQSPPPQRLAPKLKPGVAFGSGRTPTTRRPAPLKRGAGSDRMLGR